MEGVVDTEYLLDNNAIEHTGHLWGEREVRDLTPSQTSPKVVSL